MTEKRYDNGKFAKWYYCQTNTICDGTNRYYLGSKEPTPDFDKKVLLGTNQLLDLLNELHEENEQLKQDKIRLIGYLHRCGIVDVEDIDELILNTEWYDSWGELYYD